MLIRELTAQDIPFACSLINIEGWGNTEADLKRLLGLDPHGSFIALDGNNPLGIITTIGYDTFAFMGNLIIAREHRGHGLGTTLLEKALGYLRQRGFKTIELDGDWPAISLYRKLGFKDKYLSLRFFRPGDITPRFQSFLPDTHVAEILEFDRQLAGFNRLTYLKELLTDHADFTVACIEKGFHGFSVAKPRSGDFFLLGPTLADSPGSFEAIIREAVELHGDKILKLGLSEHNRAAIDILHKYGFNYNPPSLRMYWGARLDYEPRFSTICSGDVG